MVFLNLLYGFKVKHRDFNVYSAVGCYRKHTNMYKGGSKLMRLTKKTEMVKFKITYLPSLFTMLKLGGFFYGL